MCRNHWTTNYIVLTRYSGNGIYGIFASISGIFLNWFVHQYKLNSMRVYIKMVKYFKVALVRTKWLIPRLKLQKYSSSSAHFLFIYINLHFPCIQLYIVQINVWYCFYWCNNLVTRLFLRTTVRISVLLFGTVVVLSVFPFV